MTDPTMPDSNLEAKTLTSDAKAGQHHEELFIKGLMKLDSVHIGTAEDVREMRRRVVGVSLVLPVVLLALLPVQISFYLWLLTPSKNEVAAAAKAADKMDMAEATAALTDALASLAKTNAVEALITPMTVLISGTYLSITTICAALLFGLFKSVSESRKKETMADMQPAVAALREWTSKSE